MIGSAIRSEEGLAVCAGRTTLQADGWRIHIDPVHVASTRTQELSKTGGYGISHVGMIQRVDHSSFLLSQADDLLAAMHYCLSFARGFWVAPLLLAGFAETDGDPVWEKWEHDGVDAWRPCLSWFPGDTVSGILTLLFPGFIRCWGNPLWRDTLKRIIWWYISSNIQSGGVDGGIILAQVALELLAWVVYVEDGRIVSRQGFEGLPAADKLRLLLRWMNAPLDIPRELKGLADFAGSRYPYGPYAFTEIRNALVHPKNRMSISESVHAVVDAWGLGLWYLELGILRACDYKGPYMNRVRGQWRGDTEDVPWK